MPWLLCASIIWGFSFGILKGLVQQTDPFVVNAIRTVLAALFFMPWFLSLHLKTSGSALSGVADRQELKATKTSIKILRAFVSGALQIGLMYGPYTLAFKYISAHEVAFFTMTTPIIMSLIFMVSQFVPDTKDRNFARGNHVILAAVIATVGGLVASWSTISSRDFLIGAGLVQLSNVFFALGTLLWSRWFKEDERSTAEIMAPYFLGAFVVSFILAWLFSSGSKTVTPDQWLPLLWLGVMASGVGFFLWNKGALRVSSGTLSVANNLKLPIAIAISIAFFHERANILQVSVGTALVMFALRITAYRPQTKQQHSQQPPQRATS